VRLAALPEILSWINDAAAWPEILREAPVETLAQVLAELGQRRET